MMNKKPCKVFELAVKGMLPKSPWVEQCIVNSLFMSASMNKQHKNLNFWTLRRRRANTPAGKLNYFMEQVVVKMPLPAFV